MVDGGLDEGCVRCGAGANLRAAAAAESAAPERRHGFSPAHRTPPHGKCFEIGPPSGRARVPEFLWVFAVFGRFPWASGRLSLPSQPYFRVFVFVAIFLSTETSLHSRVLDTRFWEPCLHGTYMCHWGRLGWSGTSGLGQNRGARAH